MSDLDQAMARIHGKKYPPVDLGDFAVEIEKQANTLADSGWTNEAVHLRKWASELRGRSLKTSYTKDLSQASQD
jgi:hypothetical protein